MFNSYVKLPGSTYTTAYILVFLLNCSSLSSPHPRDTSSIGATHVADPAVNHPYKAGNENGHSRKCIKMLAFMRKWRFMMIHHLKIAGIFSHKAICISQYEKRRDWSRI